MEQRPGIQVSTMALRHAVKTANVMATATNVVNLPMATETAIVNLARTMNAAINLALKIANVMAVTMKVVSVKMLANAVHVTTLKLGQTTS